MRIFMSKRFTAAATTCALLLTGAMLLAAPFDAVVNEMSQGASGNKEWVEILVLKDDLDMRGWEMGDFDADSSGPVWHGLVSFSSDAAWSAVKRGTLIVIYNGGDVDTIIPGPDTDFADYSVLIPHNNTTYFADIGDWPSGAFANSDNDDIAAIRDAADVMVHDMAVTHPATVTGPGSGQVKYFTKGSTNEIIVNANWTAAPAAAGTPGVGNGGSNTAWITSLRATVPTNIPPLVQVPGDQFVIVSNTLRFAVTATEGDGDALSLTNLDTVANGQFFRTNGTGSAAGTFQFTPSAAQAGISTNLRFRATDKDGSNTKTVTVSVVALADCGVLFSEYVEGSGNNKAVEIYNGTDSRIDLAAEQYVVQIYANGGSSPSSTIALEGTLRSTETFLLANPNAGSALLNLATMTGNLNFNGDDAVVLRSGGAAGPILDCIGQVGFDPGTAWGSPPEATVEQTLRRKSDVRGGDTVHTDVFDPAQQWEGFPQDTFDGLGVHSNGCGTPEPPLSSYNSMSLVGDFNGFSPSATFMSLVDDYVWAVSLADIQRPTNRFQFVANTNYFAGQWGETNQTDFFLPISATAEVGGFGTDIRVSNNLAGFTTFRFNETNLAYSIENAAPVSLAVAGSFNGTNVTPNLTRVSNSLWEGHFTLVGLTGATFRFYANGATNAVWGDNNQSDFDPFMSGTAEPGGSSSNILIAAVLSGSYKFTFDHETLQYTVSLDTSVPITLFQDFNDWPLSDGYGTTSHEGWTLNNGYVDTLNALSGRAGRFRNVSPTGSDQFLLSPFVSQGLGLLSFWYRNWTTNSSGASSFVVEKSDNATNWVAVVSTNNITTTNYTQYSVVLNDTNRYFVRIRKSAGNERLLLDDVFLTSDTNTSDVLISDVQLSPEHPWTNDSVSVSAKIDLLYGATDPEVQLFYKKEGAANYTTIAMAANGSRYETISEIPPFPTGSKILYFIRVDFQGPGSSSTSPRFYPSDGNPTFYGISRNPPGSVWINEIDYWNLYGGTDVFDGVVINGEFVELAGAAGINISGFSIELMDYREAFADQPFDRYTITNFVMPDDTLDGYGFFVLGGSNVAPRDILMTNYLSSYIPGAVRLRNEFGILEQEIAYGGTPPGVETPGTDDVDTIDILLLPYTNSVALVGGGNTYGEFNWSTNRITPGAANHFQSFGFFPQMDCSNLFYACTNQVPAATNYVGVNATGTCGNLTVTLSFLPPEVVTSGAGCPSDPLFIYRTYRAVSQCGTTSECVQVITVSDTNRPDAVFATTNLANSLPSGIRLWLKADAGVGATGGSITNWLDQSTNGYHFAQTNLARTPTLATNELGNLTVRFGGSNFLDRLDALGLSGNPGLTVFAVASARDFGHLRILHLGDNLGAGGKTIAFSSDSSFRYNDGSRIFADNLLIGGVFVASWLQPAATNYGAGRFYQDGSEAIATGGSNPNNLLNLENELAMIGAGESNNLAADYFKGDVSELIVYNRALSTQEMETVGFYLSERWGLSTLYTSTVPATVLSVGSNSCTATLPSYQSYLVSATDGCGGGTSVTQLPPSGSQISTGTHTVQVRVADACGNFSSLNVTVRVVDVFGPSVVSMPTNLTTECRSPSADNASNGDYLLDGWQTGDDGGSGWGAAWSLVTTNIVNAGHYVGDSRNNSFGNDTNGDGDINTAGVKAWGMYANNGASAEAFRRFGWPLQRGNTFSLDMDNGWVSGGGVVGFALQNHQSGSTLLEVLFLGNNPTYSIQDSRGFISTGLPWTDEGIRARITLTGTNTYSAYLRRLQDNVSVTITGITMASSGLPIDRVRLFNYQAGGGSEYDLFFNRLAIDDLPPVDVTAVKGTDTCSQVTVTHVGDSSTNTSTCVELISRTYRVSDSSGNFTERTQVITRRDLQAPVIDCSITNFSINAGLDCVTTELPNLTTNVTAEDMCGEVTLTQVPTAGTAVASGILPVKIIATDNCGLASTCTLSVAIEDIAPPVNMICQVVDSNRLLNSSFEFGQGTGFGTTVISNWSRFGPNVLREALSPRTGTYALKIFGSGSGSPNYSGAFQDLPATQSQHWRALAYGLTRADDAMSGQNNAYINLEFYDFATNILTAHTSRKLLSTMPQNTYVKIAVDAVAPVGTVIARIVPTFQQFDGASGSIFFDDLRLELVETSVTVPDAGSVPPVDTNLLSVLDTCDYTPAITLQSVVTNQVGIDTVITRTWRATDDESNYTECQQIITIAGESNAPPVEVVIRRVTLTSTNVTVYSSGTNGWLASAQYATNLPNIPQAWFPIAAYSNSFAGGTNTTWFGYPTNLPHLYIRVLNAE